MFFDIGIYQLDVDVEKTAAFYRADGDITCDCAGCRNYAKAVAELPASVLQFFHQFGVAPAKPAEMAAVHSTDGNMTLYDGHYYICGTIIEGKTPYIQVSKKQCRLDERYKLKLGDDCSVFFSDECMGYQLDCPKPAIEASVTFLLPWVLDEPNPYT